MSQTAKGRAVTCNSASCALKSTFLKGATVFLVLLILIISLLFSQLIKIDEILIPLHSFLFIFEIFYAYKDIYLIQLQT